MVSQYTADVLRSAMSSTSPARHELYIYTGTQERKISWGKTRHRSIYINSDVQLRLTTHDDDDGRSSGVVMRADGAVAPSGTC